MPNVFLGVYLPLELKERIKGVAKDLQASNPGIKYTQSDAARWLLERALETMVILKERKE